MATSSRVTVVEVGPRDGLQNEPEVLDVETRAELIGRLAATGLPAIELASFVDPRHMPQMAQAEEVVAAAGEQPRVVRAGLALYERATSVSWRAAERDAEPDGRAESILSRPAATSTTMRRPRLPHGWPKGSTGA